MNLAAVANEMKTRLEAIPSLLVVYLGQGTASVTTPCAVVPMPDVQFNQTYQQGMTRIPWEIALLAGKIDDKNAFDRLGVYADGSGAESVIEALQSTPAKPYTACDVITVVSATFDLVTWQDQDFQGALFTLDVVGR
jgi:hypothetical protein